MSPSILVVEDEAPILSGLVERLEREGFKATAAEDGEAGEAALTGGDFDLVVLDLMLPGIGGEELLRRMRAGGDRTPVLVLSARGRELDRVLLLTLGADDYVVKPFSVRELIARIRAILRRAETVPVLGPLRFGDVEFRPDAYEIEKAGTVHPITATECRMLELLLSRAGSAVSREEFLRAVWGYERVPETRTVDFHVTRLRKKIETDPKHPRYLITVRGAGYRLVTGEDR